MSKHLEQGTQEWLDWRRSKIGASDVPIIMGISPYKTPFQLWQSKLNLVPDKPMGAHMRAGHDREEACRDWVKEQTGLLFIPEVIENGTSRPYLMASLDGLSFPCGKVILEVKNVKCLYHDQALNGQVPDIYYPQVQAQLDAHKRAEYLIYNSNRYRDPNDRCMVEVKRDDAYIEEMLHEVDKFWNFVQTKTPPPMTDRDFKTPKGELHEKLTRLAQLKEYHTEYEELKKEIKEDCAGQNYDNGDIKVTTYAIPGRVDFKAIECLKDVDLEVYRKPSSLGTRISFS